MARKKKGQEMELTPYETAFARNLVSGLSYAKAYNASGYKTTGNHKYAYLRGKKIANRPHVQAYMETLRQSAWVNSVMSFEEKRMMLAQIARAKPQDIDETKAFVSLSVDADGKRTLQGPKVAEKIKAIELDMRAAGELGEDNDRTNIAIQLVSERLSIPSAEPLALPD
jgi:hypothetical protein